MATRMLSFNNITSSIGASLPNPLRAKKKFHFDVTLTLQELVNCTFVSGVLFAKLQLKDGGSFNGTSHRSVRVEVMKNAFVFFFPFFLSLCT